ncbi:MAG: hypothetical protein K2L18_02230, partial [Acetatifactor sp.]|nr:hypothetical protein [Acetatifactor sp.]
MQDLTSQISHILEEKYGCFTSITDSDNNPGAASVMQERGNFEYGSGSLDFSCTKIELILQPGECYEGSFGVEVHGSGHTVGWISSSD